MPSQHTTAQANTLMRFTLAECNAILPLVRSISTELVERRAEFKTLRAQRKELEAANSPEGLSVAISDLEARILEQEDGILQSCEELTRHGLTVHRLSPLIVHFPGRTGTDEVMFCWSESEALISHEHSCEDDGMDCPTESQFIHSGYGYPQTMAMTETQAEPPTP